MVTVMVWVAVVPTVTCPKSIEVRLLPRDPEFPPPFELLELAVTPPHPQSATNNDNRQEPRKLHKSFHRILASRAQLLHLSSGIH